MSKLKCYVGAGIVQRGDELIVRSGWVTAINRQIAEERVYLKLYSEYPDNDILMYHVALTKLDVDKMLDDIRGCNIVFSDVDD